MGRHIRKSKQCTFFTKPEIAKRLIDETHIERFKLVIEPSAGDGSFSRQIDGYQWALDIDPKHPSITKCDFLKFQYNGEVDRKDILCIGNPPFGPNGSLALAFIKKCAEIADTIAFILPLSYKKESMQARIPEYYHLAKQIDLPLENALLDGEPQEVPVIFQIWERKWYLRPKPIHLPPVGFSYVKRDQAHFCVRRVGMRAGKASRELSPSITAHYYIRLDLDNTIWVDTAIQQLNRVKWEHNNTVGQRSISKNELTKVLTPILML
jgi:hypothetical protein